MGLDGFLTVGSGNPYHKKAELYEFGTGAWLEVDDYPIEGTSVFNYDMVFIPETSSYYVIGGQYKGAGEESGPASQIGKFTNGFWSDAGQLKSVRIVSFRKFFTIIETTFQEPPCPVV